MMLSVAVISFVLNAFDIAVESCDAAWLSTDLFAQMLSAEMAEVDEARREGMRLVVHGCTDDTVLLTVSNASAEKSREVDLGKVAEEARQRTVAIALGELAELTLTLGPGRTTRFHPALSLEAGWVRGVQSLCRRHIPRGIRGALDVGRGGRGVVRRRF